MNGVIPQGFVLMSRMPYKVNDTRFKKSEVWYPPGYIKPKDGEDLTNNNDALSVQTAKKNKDKKMYTQDIEI